MATGKLYMARPGKIRFEYDPPSPILLLSDGYFLRYVDKDLKQVTHLWLRQHADWVFTRRRYQTQRKHNNYQVFPERQRFDYNSNKFRKT